MKSPLSQKLDNYTIKIAFMFPITYFTVSTNTHFLTRKNIKIQLLLIIESQNGLLERTLNTI